MSDTDLKDQRVTGEAISTFQARMLKTPKDKRTIGWFKTNLEALEEQWKEFQARHKILVRCEDIMDKNYFTQYYYGETQNNYVMVKSVIQNALCPGRNVSPIQADIDYEQVVLEGPSHRSPLKPIGLPDFSGDQLEWETFREMFTALVHNVPSIPPVLKLQYLLGAVSGEAAKRLKNIQVNGNNYQDAWDILVKKYNNKHVLLAAHMNNIIACPSASKKSAEEIERIIGVMKESRRGLSNMNCPVETWGSWFVQFTVNKLDSATREDWELFLGDNEEFPSFEKLTAFLESYIRARDSARANDSSRAQPAEASRANKPKHHKPAKAHSISAEPQSSRRHNKACPMCKESHSLASCDKYKKLTVYQRRAFIDETKLCESCLKPNHVAESCRAGGRCFLCNQKHHTSIHTSTPEVGIQGNLPISTHSYATSSLLEPAAAHSTSAHQRVLLATALVELQNERGTTVTARELLDQGAEFSFVTERVAQCLALPRTEVDIPILGIGSASPGLIRAMVNVKLKSSAQPQFEINMEALVLKKLTALIPSMKIITPTYAHLKGITFADPDFGTPGVVDCIIGAELYGRLLTGKLLQGASSEPTAQETVFGWIISGPVSPLTNACVGLAAGVFHARTDRNLHDSLQAFWRVEEPPTAPSLSPNERVTMEHFKATNSRASDGRFVIRLPLKEPDPNFGDSKSIAIARCLQTEKRLARDPVLAKL